MFEQDENVISITPKMNEVKASSVKLLQAEEGHILPIFYLGSIIRIGHNEPVEIDFEKLGYEPKLQLQRAIDLNYVIEIGDK